jgi:hypothetical protein
MTYFPSVRCTSDAGKIKVTCDNLPIFYLAFFFFGYQTPAELWDSLVTYRFILWR